MERKLIEHCSPTLAGLKCASLFRYLYKGINNLKRELEEINHLLNQKGVYVDALKWGDDSALIYVYRKAMLERELQREEVLELLQEFGYNNSSFEEHLKHLKNRVKQSDCFPHEIGVFLGYPLEDVKGFIEHGGKNCESCGVWKVYCNKEEKALIFQKMKKCKEVYQRVFFEGRGLLQMTVCC